MGIACTQCLLLQSRHHCCDVQSRTCNNTSSQQKQLAYAPSIAHNSQTQSRKQQSNAVASRCAIQSGCCRRHCAAALIIKPRLAPKVRTAAAKRLSREGKAATTTEAAKTQTNKQTRKPLEERNESSEDSSFEIKRQCV